jgi:UDP-N-acetylmuramyl pentapeptide phosphotransferase/UDP-N-acetylglucosamine-1-phosphate transferase
LILPLVTAISFVAHGFLLWLDRQVALFPHDVPGGRKVHRRPVPLAGVATGVAAIGILLVHGEHVLALAAGIATLTGWLDDRGKAGAGGLLWTAKLPALLAAAGLVALDATRDPVQLLALAALAFVLINAFNFLDNTDGVSPCLGICALGLLAPGAALAQSAGTLERIGATYAGFLLWNWPRPYLFLGDAGAYCLGICVAAGCCDRIVQGAVLAGLLPVAIPLLDFVQVVGVRVWRGIPPWNADHRHLTHRCRALGCPVVLVAPLFLVAALVIFAVGSGVG